MVPSAFRLVPNEPHSHSAILSATRHKLSWEKKNGDCHIKQHGAVIVSDVLCIPLRINTRLCSSFF